MLLGLDQLQNVVGVIYGDKQLKPYALLHSLNEFPRLNELPDVGLGVEAAGDGDLHGGGYLLDLLQSVLVDQRLRLVDGGARRHRRDRRLVLRVFENQPDHRVDVPDRHVHLVVKVQRGVERVVNIYLGGRHLLGLVPEAILTWLEGVAFVLGVRNLFDQVGFFLLLGLDDGGPLDGLDLLNLRLLLVEVLVEGGRQGLLLFAVLTLHALLQFFQAHLVLVQLKVGVVVDELLLELLL